MRSEDLVVRQETHQFVLEIYRLSRAFPRSETSESWPLNPVYLSSDSSRTLPLFVSDQLAPRGRHIVVELDQDLIHLAIEVVAIGREFQDKAFRHDLPLLALRREAHESAALQEPTEHSFAVGV